MDILFVSYGAYCPETENYFSKLKTYYPEIKRTHGLETQKVKQICMDIVDTRLFLLIDIKKGIENNIQFDRLEKFYEIVDTRTIKRRSLKYNKSTPDIMYLTYSEKQAEDNFIKLLKKYPKIKRLHRVNGLSRAFRISAELIESSYYILIDGDNEVLDDFDLYSITAPQKDQMYFYMAKNPVNNLVYGYGGIKSCPTANFRKITDNKIDPIASGGIVKITAKKEIASITKFNTSPFNAWKAGFREAVMLTNQDDELTMSAQVIKEKLHIWQTIGIDKENGIYTMNGAIEGEKYGMKYKNNHKELFRINDPEWLKKTYNKLGYPEDES